MAAESQEQTFAGEPPFRYERLLNWEQLPEGWSLTEAVGVATDSADNVYVFDRGEHPIIVFDRDGKFLRSWGEGQFKRPHGIWIGPDDMLYLSDDHDHTVRKFTPEGELVMTLGVSGQASDTGIDGMDYRTLKKGCPPFNMPTNLALGAQGEMYITDGYGNARVHKFSPEGELLLSWGEPGSEPGQFNLPHGITVDGKGRVIVSDRENSRLQFFDAEGEFITQWTDVVRPCDAVVDGDDNVYVAEVGMRAGVFPWMKADPSQPGGRISIFNSEGKLLCRWGGGDDPLSPTDFYTPHDIWLDSRGDMYIGEVVRAAASGIYADDVPKKCPTLKKYRKVND